MVMIGSECKHLYRLFQDEKARGYHWLVNLY